MCSMVQNEVIRWLQLQGYGEVVGVEPVSGGCINNGQRITTSAGQTLFLKQNSRAPDDMFFSEARGLEALQKEHVPRVPKVYIYGETFILLEDLKPASPIKDFWILFGHQLATLHKYTNDRFGFDHDNYIGSTRQLNPWTDNGHEFFGRFRLVFQAELAYQRKLMPAHYLDKIVRLADMLKQLVPKQPASLIHGDLWRGNVITDAEGNPAIIDPATHYGWAEAELAMTDLFGGFPDSFYAAYIEVNPLNDGFRDRFPIYNLYHLLNHLNIFGASYWARVKQIVDFYVGE